MTWDSNTGSLEVSVEGSNQLTGDILPGNSLISISKEDTLQSCENALRLLSNWLITTAKEEQSSQDEVLGQMIQNILNAMEYARCQQE